MDYLIAHTAGMSLNGKTSMAIWLTIPTLSAEALVHQLKIAGIIVPLTVISMAVLLFLYLLLLDFPEITPLKESFGWTVYIAILATPVWIPVSFVPSGIYLIIYWSKNGIQRLQER